MTIRPALRAPSLLLALLLLAPAAGARAQDPGWDPGRLLAGRAELEAMLRRYEQATASDVYSRGIREQARMEMEMVRERLAEGDFRPGDRIALSVEGQTELTDTFTVRTGRVIVLPAIGDVSVAGLLRSELEPALREQIGRYVRDPAVQATSLIRVSVTGEVGAPGFYDVPSSALLSDVVMQAGGPTGQGRLDEIRVRRGERVLWRGDRLQTAMNDGRTLDQLNLRAGDAVEVPGRSGPSIGSVVRALPYVVPLAIGIWQLF